MLLAHDDCFEPVGAVNRLLCETESVREVEKHIAAMPTKRNSGLSQISGSSRPSKHTVDDCCHESVWSDVHSCTCELWLTPTSQPVDVSFVGNAQTVVMSFLELKAKSTSAGAARERAHVELPERRVGHRSSLLVSLHPSAGDHRPKGKANEQ